MAPIIVRLCSTAIRLRIRLNSPPQKLPHRLFTKIDRSRVQVMSAAQQDNVLDLMTTAESERVTMVVLNVPTLGAALATFTGGGALAFVAGVHSSTNRARDVTFGCVVFVETHVVTRTGCSFVIPS